MSGFHDIGKPWYEQSTTLALYVVVMLAYASFVIFPIPQNNWSWAANGASTLFATGLLLGIYTVPLWAAYSDKPSRFLYRCALLLSVLAFIAIAIPAFSMVLPHVPMAPAA